MFKLIQCYFGTGIQEIILETIISKACLSPVWVFQSSKLVVLFVFASKLLLLQAWHLILKASANS